MHEQLVTAAVHLTAAGFANNKVFSVLCYTYNAFIYNINNPAPDAYIWQTKVADRCVFGSDGLRSMRSALQKHDNITHCFILTFLSLQAGSGTETRV